MGRRGPKPGHGVKAPNSGRKKGTPNKITKNFVTSLEERGIDPLDYVEKALKSKELDAEKKAKLVLSLLDYYLPKRKPVDGDGSSVEKQEILNVTEWS